MRRHASIGAVLGDDTGSQHNVASSAPEGDEIPWYLNLHYKALGRMKRELEGKGKRSVDGMKKSGSLESPM